MQGCVKIVSLSVRLSRPAQLTNLKEEEFVIMSELLNVKMYIFDMDGTIYLGGHVFPDSLKTVRQLRQRGKKVLFFTNNASRCRDAYIEKLSALGFGPSPDEVLTAGNVTEAFLRRHRPGRRVYLLGTDELRGEFAGAGIALCDTGPADIVVSSFDTGLTYEKVLRACRLIADGAEYLCTHPDLNCPTDEGIMPDSGAISAMITASTGVRPRVFGKPSASTVDMISELTGICPREMAFVGDRLETDIAVGRQNGAVSILTLTGVTGREEAQAAAEHCRPDYIVNNLSGILTL